MDDGQQTPQRAEEASGEYQVCSRCYNRRPKEQFLGGGNRTRCIRCRMHDAPELRRYRRRQALKAAKPKPPANGSKPAAKRADPPDGFSAAETNPNVTLAVRLKTILRKAMEPQELAERLCNLARSADERIASASLETLMALQGVVVPKRPEEQSEQRFFVMSASLTPKVEPDFLETVPSPAPNEATTAVTPTNKAHKVA